MSIVRTAQLRCAPRRARLQDSRPSFPVNHHEGRGLYPIRPPDVVQIQDLEKAVPTDHEVLIKVRAASVNPLDEGIVKGGGRMVTGLRKPNITRLGVDVAGQVEAVARTVSCPV
jgi:D-arabinose 1-dehydrogenase-like Zn-dependent alcohol dehydrogenase